MLGLPLQSSSSSSSSSSSISSADGKGSGPARDVARPGGLLRGSLADPSPRPPGIHRFGSHRSAGGPGFLRAAVAYDAASPEGAGAKPPRRRSPDRKTPQPSRLRRGQSRPQMMPFAACRRSTTRTRATQTIPLWHGPPAATGRSSGLIAPHGLVAGNDEGRTGRPGACPAAAGPSARAAAPSFCGGDAGLLEACPGRGASGEDAALASAFGLRLTQTAEESTCRTGGPERHDHILFLPCLAEPQRAKRRRRRRRPRRLPAAPLTSEQGHSLGRTRTAARTTRAGVRSRTERRLLGIQITGGQPPVIATWGWMRGNQAAHSPHGRRKHGARGSRSPGVHTPKACATGVRAGVSQRNMLAVS